MNPNTRSRLLTVPAFVATLAMAGISAGQTAGDILKATGVRGGLVVHVGCGDGKLTAALRANDSYLVQGLDTDAANVAKAREHVRSLGLYGKVSIEHWSPGRLPYTDNLVNLIVAGDLHGVAMSEVMRVLAPEGVAYVKRAQPGKAEPQWTKTVKPRPAQLDEWTHYLHDAGGNAVAHDAAVGPPRHMQWLARPTWTRNHHTLASISAVVSAGGRIFTIVDEGPAASMLVPGKWFLVARDAFNGVLLWKKPISSWAYHRKKFRSGPIQLPRTLVAAGPRVYAPLGIDSPLSALDAADGKVVRAYPGTKNTEEVILCDGVLLVVTGSPTAEQALFDPAMRRGKYPNEKTIRAIRAETGRVLWKWSRPGSSAPVPLTLAAGGTRVFFQDGRGVLCLDRNTGKKVWGTGTSAATARGAASASPKDQKRKKGRKPKPKGGRSAGVAVSTLVVHDGVVLSADGRRLAALSAETGKPLWSIPCKPGFRSPTDVFVAGGLVWLGPEFAEGRDPRTGRIKKRGVAASNVWTAGHHHRCYREKATDRYIMTGYRGIEFLDLAGDNHSRNNWIRGCCQYGIMPCNGLVYAPSHACGCFMEAKLWGFWAVAAARQPRAPDAGGERLQRGPAYGKVGGVPSRADDWPTHRHDALRSGSTPAALPGRLRQIWRADVGGRLSAPVVAAGTVLLSDIDGHRVVAMDAGTGKERWSFTAGGRVDSPPTVHNGLVLFGSADGWVYALRLADGELAWRFRAAPEELKTVALGQVESIWPVHGSVLVQGGVACFTAGRSSWLDGGILLYGLDPATGKTLWRTPARSEHPKVAREIAGRGGGSVKKIVQNATDYRTFNSPDKSDAFSMGGTTSDIMVGDGTSVFLRHLRFSRNGARQAGFARHLFSTSGLLDDAEVHRSHWVLGGGDFSRLPVSYSWIVNKGGGWGSRIAVPYGLVMAFDEGAYWSVHRTLKYQYKLVAGPNRPFSPGEKAGPDFRKAGSGKASGLTWSVDLPMRPRAMIRAGGALLIGGMPATIGRADPHAAYEGRAGGLLWVVSPQNGRRTAEHKLDAPPVWDGLAAANGRLYVSTANGKLLCFAGR